jgi:hypothetical protein
MTKLQESLPTQRIQKITQINPKLFRISFQTEQDYNSALKHYRDLIIPGSTLEPPRRNDSKFTGPSSIVRSVNPDILEDEFIAYLKEHHINATTARRIISSKTGKPSHIVRVTLKDQDTAKSLIEQGHLELGTISFPVEAPRKRHLPLRCYNCQQYDHHQATCKNPRICNLCAGDHPADTPCTEETRCANCDGPHAASSNECGVWITKLKEKNENHRTRSVQDRNTTPQARASPTRETIMEHHHEQLTEEIADIRRTIELQQAEIQANKALISELPTQADLQADLQDVKTDLETSINQIQHQVTSSIQDHMAGFMRQLQTMSAQMTTINERLPPNEFTKPYKRPASSPLEDKRDNKSHKIKTHTSATTPAKTPKSPRDKTPEAIQNMIHDAKNKPSKHN